MSRVKNLIKDNRKVLLLAVFMLVFVTACTSVRNSDGTIDKAMLITFDTNYMECIKEGWFNIFVWPVAQLINFVAQYSDAGIGIIVATLLLNFGTAALSIKQQVASQKMQLLQPELQRIQGKYAGKTDQASKMKQATEMQNLYSKHKISPFGSMLTMFIQLPIIFAVYQAVMRAESVYKGEFLGTSLFDTPIVAFNNQQMVAIIIFLLMIVAQFASMKLPQIMQKRMKEKSKVKTKDYANPNANKGNGMMGSMNTMMYMMLGMTILFAINWPLGMSFYWLVSALTRIIQNVVIQKFFIKNEF